MLRREGDSAAASASSATATASMAAAQKGSVCGKKASDILMTEEPSGEMVNLEEILDGKSTIVLEWWGFH